MTLNLTSDLVSRNCIESGAYLQYSLKYEFQIVCVNASTHNLKVERLFLAVPQGCLRFVIVVSYSLTIFGNISSDLDVTVEFIYYIFL